MTLHNNLEKSPDIHSFPQPENKKPIRHNGLVIDYVRGESPFTDFARSKNATVTYMTSVPKNLLELILTKHFSFVVVHNYDLNDEKVLKSVLDAGIPLLLIKRDMVPEQLKLHFFAFHKRLFHAGAHLGRSHFRYDDMYEFLEKLLAHE
jgi:hypothetical protein